MARRFPVFSSGYELSLTDLPRTDAGLVRWEEVFGEVRPLRVEVGVGNSFFLIEVARRAPDFNYLGFEYSRKRVLKFLKKVEAAKLTAIRMLSCNACIVLESAVDAGSVDHFYINHPDPWPKRRHAKKRFVSPRNVQTMLRLLRKGGGLSLRTDVPQYAEEMLEILDATEGLSNLAGQGSFADQPLEPFTTAYEKKFLEEGRRIYYLEYTKHFPERGTAANEP